MKFELGSLKTGIRASNNPILLLLLLTYAVFSTRIESLKNQITLKKGGGGGGGATSGGVLAIIAAGVGGTFGFLFLLIIGGQIGGSSGIYGNLPTSNITAITGNIGKAVVTGSNFVVLIYLGAGVAIAASMIFLALHVFQRRG